MLSKCIVAPVLASCDMGTQFSVHPSNSPFVCIDPSVKVHSHFTGTTIPTIIKSTRTFILKMIIMDIALYYTLGLYYTPDILMSGGI